jgi:type IV fimbrial biogenesis protein FimT
MGVMGRFLMTYRQPLVFASPSCRAGLRLARILSHNHPRGYSIVEVMVVLVIAGVVTAYALPNFANLVKDNRQIAAVNQLVASMQFARSAAVSRQTAVTVLSGDSTDAKNEWGQSWTIFLDVDRDEVHDAGEELLRSEVSIDNVFIDSLNNVASIQFLPVGIIGSAPIAREFMICDDRTAEAGRQVTITGTGKVSTADASCE